MTQSGRIERERRGDVGGLVSNIALLYGIQAANLLLPLINVPYLMRVLGASGYGKVAFAAAVMAYLSAVVDFGFNITAARAAAAARGEVAELGKLILSVGAVRCGLLMISVVALAFIIRIPQLNEYGTLLIASALVLPGTMLFPGAILQGMEQMRLLAVASVAGRAACVALTFLLVHEPADATLAAFLQSAALIISVLLVAGPVLKLVPLRYWRIDLPTMRVLLAESGHVFVSSSAVTVYSSGITIVLGVSASPAAVGVFSAATKIVVAMASALWAPLSQGAYPRLVALLASGDTKAADHLLRRLLWTVLPVALSMMLLIWILSAPIVTLALGRGMSQAAPLLRVLIVLPAMLVISNFFGLLVLFVNGLFREVSRIQAGVALACAAWGVPLVLEGGASGAAWSVVITETIITGALLYACHKHGLLAWMSRVNVQLARQRPNPQSPQVTTE